VPPLWPVIVDVPWAFPLTMGGLGLLLGSFLNVVRHRLPRMLERQWRNECAALLEAATAEDGAETRYNLMVPRSHCPACHHPIAPRDNIPLLSWCLLRGRCRHCQARIPVHYPLVELACGLAFAGIAWQFGPGWQALWGAVLTAGLLALALIDLDTQLLPDSLTQPLLWLGLIVNSHQIFASPSDALAGAVAGYLCLWSVYWSFRLLTGREGMGQGDFKLLALLGAWLGWQALPMILFGASLVGAGVGITLIVATGRGRHEPLPFGPFLAGAGWLMLLWGTPLLELWLAGTGGAR
jgi:leader peptidase (prepilin peptidase)/N-methyltransferase